MTKGELVQSALNEIGIADYEFDISAEELESGVRRLDSMMAMWSSKGVILSYPLGGDSESSDESNIPDTAWEAVVTNLALRLAPSYGKAVAQELKKTAKESYNVLLGLSVSTKEMQFPSMPKGQGYKNVKRAYSSAPVEQFIDNIDDEVDPSGGYDGE